MKRSLAVLIVGAVLLAAISGCSHSDSSTASSNPHTFSYSVTNLPASGDTLWIIVSSPDGATPIAARCVTQNGLVDFGDIGNDHVTVTFLHTSTSDFTDISSYVNALAGDWKDVTGEPDDTSGTKGTADITVNLPASHPGMNDAYVYVPAATWRFNSIAADCTQLHRSDPVLDIEDGNRFSAFCVLTAMGGPSYLGWIADQPFTSHVSNSYTFNLTESWQTKTITATRRLNFLSAQAYRGASMKRFYETAADSLSPTDFAMKYTTFPVTKYGLRGYGYAGDESYFYDEIRDDLPSTLDVPATSIAATYSSPENKFYGVNVSGASDCITAYWSDASGVGVRWRVSVAPGTSIISRPILPDSITTASHLNGIALYGQALGLFETDADHNWNDYIDHHFKNNAEQWPPAYTRMFQYFRSVHAGVPLTAEDLSALTSARHPGSRF